MHPLLATAIAIEVTADRMQEASDARVLGRRSRFSALRGPRARRRTAAPPGVTVRPAPVRAGR
jgi:hypothetical protein